MKANYKNNDASITLMLLDYGELFYLANSRSQTIYMKTSCDASETLFNECSSRLLDYYLDDYDTQDYCYQEPCDLIVCVNINSGDIVLLHEELEVVELKYNLEIEN